MNYEKFEVNPISCNRDIMCLSPFNVDLRNSPLKVNSILHFNLNIILVIEPLHFSETHWW